MGTAIPARSFPSGSTPILFSFSGVFSISMGQKFLSGRLPRQVFRGFQGDT